MVLVFRNAVELFSANLSGKPGFLGENFFADVAQG